MDDENKYIHEAYAAIAGREIKRLWMLIFLLVVLLVGTNISWLYYENQFADEVTTTIDATQDGDGYNLISGGSLNYEPKSESYNN